MNSASKLPCAEPAPAPGTLTLLGPSLADSGFARRKTKA